MAELEHRAAFKALAAFNKAHESEWGGGGTLHPEFAGLVDRMLAASARERSAREQVRRLIEVPKERAAWKDALPTIRASVERARSAPEAVMRAPRSEARIATVRGAGGTKGDKNREKTAAALARLTPTDKEAAKAQQRRDRLNSTEGMQTRHEMHVLSIELELARAQVNAATPGTAGYRSARANAAAIGARVNANGQRYRDIESGTIKVGPPRTEPMTFTSSGKSKGGASKAAGSKAAGTTGSKPRVGSHEDPQSGIRIPNDATDLQAREMVRYANNHYRDLLGMSPFPSGRGEAPAALTSQQAASVRRQVNAWFKEQKAAPKTA